MTNKNFFRTSIRLTILFAIVILHNACGANKSYIFLVDWTDSVSVSAREKVFETIGIQAKELGRGDSITIIPITGDSLIESSGNVIRLEAGEIRKLRDKDLKEFQANIQAKLNKIKSESKTFNQTDIFGALQIAQEEAETRTKQGRKVYVIAFSDMVHSTNEMRFETNNNFASSANSIEYARQISESKRDDWSKTEIYLGSLESTDLKKMSNERREALREFWKEYFKTGNAARFQYATDGTGQALSFTKP